MRLGVGAGACVAAATLGIGLRPLADNSFFTHLATGRFLLEHGSVPSSDPYTFTASGEPWVVQSWLASWLYATAEALGGATGLRLVIAAITLLVVGVAWRLTRPAPALLVRLALATLFVAASAGLWAERPFMFGLVGMGLVALMGQGELDARVALPIGWLWANLHGSFPLGVGYLVVVALGCMADRVSAREPLRAAGVLTIGIVVGAVGPLGPKALTFPIELLQRQSLLQNVTEWRSPTYDSFSQRAFLGLIALAIVSVARRPSYRSAFVVAVFGVLAMMSLRNLPVASLVFLPVIAHAAPEVGSLRSSDRSRFGLLLAGGAVVVGLVVGSSRLGEPDFNLRRYPVDALAFIQDHDIDLAEVHLAAPDIAGNARELLEGATKSVYYDDRFDMFPEEVSEQHLTLVNGAVGSRTALHEAGTPLVLWERGSALGQQLTADADWRLLYTDERWVLFCRRGDALGGRIGRC